MKNKKEEKKQQASWPEPDDKRSFSEKINDFFLKMGNVPTKEKLFFVRHLGIMLKGGISFSSAFKTLANQTSNKLFAKVLKNIAKDIERGRSLSESLRPYDKIFDDYFINMVESGEISGKLEDVLEQLYIQMKKQHDLVSQVKAALTYPAFVIVVMIGISIFMMISVVPKITSIFSEYQAELPLMTRVLISISDFMINNGLFVIVATIVLILSVIKILRTDQGKFLFHAFLLKMPVISGMVKKINIARFSRTVSSLLRTDIMIIKTFQITAGVLSNVHYKNIILKISEKIKKGGQINEIVKDYPAYFPPVVTQMIMVGEQTGELDNILSELAEFYEEEVEKTLETLPSLIEPLLILILGIGVGLMAAAIILPMYFLTSAV